jgi:predicted heme/steroid binding protein
MSHRAALLLTGGSLGSIAAAYVAYDYQTCHPFRKMNGYDMSGAWIRFHNSFRPNSTFRKMALAELDKFDGSSGRPTYFSSEGFVWDVSTSGSFQDSYGFFKGKDATICLAKMSMDRGDINRTDWDELTDKELESLHSWTRYFSEKYMIKARLKEFES